MTKKAWIAAVPLLVIAVSAFALQQQERQEERGQAMMGGMTWGDDQGPECPPGEEMGMMGRGGMMGMGDMMGMMDHPGMRARMGQRQGMKGHMPMMGHQGWGADLERMAEALELTQPQISKVKAIRVDHEKSTIRTRADLDLARLDLRQLLDQENVDLSKVEETLKRMESLRTKIHLGAIRTHEAVKQVLTPEQREKAKKLMHDRGPMNP